jgi:hypothetical protein
VYDAIRRGEAAQSEKAAAGEADSASES